MRRHSLPFAFVALALMMGLATMGVAYGQWSQSLTVSVVAKTGTFGATIAKSGDPAGSPANGGATCTTAAADGKLTVTIAGAFPGYSCQQPFTVTNAGSVPFRLALPAGAITPNTGVAVEWPSCYNANAAIPSGETASCTFKATWNDSATEDQTYTFSYDIVATQYTPGE